MTIIINNLQLIYCDKQSCVIVKLWSWWPIWICGL